VAEPGQPPASAAPGRAPGGPGGPPPGGEPDRLTAYLLPGQVHAASEPTAITTVLGSCVSVCLFDPEARVGGMNHYLLPQQLERERNPRFGNVAVELLINDVVAKGGRRGNLRAKVFGGASVLELTRPGHRPLGEENVRLALRLLDSHAIPVIDGDVGGHRGRKLVFHTDEGTAWMRLL
jgi:chemotaxis protein CheD